MSSKPRVQKKIEAGKLRNLLLEVYHDVFKEDASGIKIRCPWHKPDNNPSCIVWWGSASFYCMICHGDKQKGHRGMSPYHGFIALGMDEERARKIFLEPTSPSDIELNTSRLPSIDVIEEKPVKKILTDKVESRSDWPKYWGFRGLDYSTMIAPWFQDRFEPTKVKLRRERLPRLALNVGGAEKFRKKRTRHEVYLRVSSAVQPKAANSLGLSLDPDVKNSASLFGLINNKISAGCRGLILTEGPYDALHLLQHIHRPEVGGGFEVVCLLGTPQWANCLRQIELHLLPQMNGIPFILAFDNDPAGVKLTRTAMRDLQALCYLSQSRIKKLDYPLTIKDPGEMSLEVFMTCLKELGF